MRWKELGIAVAVLAGLGVWGYAAVLVGGALGQPDPVDPPVAAQLPGAIGGLVGFEGQGDRLESGPWGVVTAVEDAGVQVERAEGDYVLVPGKRVTVENAGQVFVFELGDDSLVRQLLGADPTPGDRVAAGDGALLVIR